LAEIFNDIQYREEKRKVCRANADYPLPTILGLPPHSPQCHCHQYLTKIIERGKIEEDLDRKIGKPNSEVEMERS